MTAKTIVILLSDKRSGSTLFGRELCKHPSIQTVAYSPHRYLETHHWLKGAVVLDMPPRTFAGGRVYAGYGSRGNARAYLIDVIQRNVPGYTVPQDDRALVFGGWDALCHQFARPVFFEKSPQLLAQWAGLSLLLEWIYDTTFRVKVIGLTRNPLSVQYSAFELFHTDPQARQFGWLETQKNLRALQGMLPPGTFYHVRYEDIVDEPHASFARICDFIGVPHEPGMGGSTHADSLTKWKDDPYFTLQLDPTVKQMAANWGYDAQELTNPPKPEPSLAYRLRRRWVGVYRLARARFRDRVVRPLGLRRRQRAEER